MPSLPTFLKTWDYSGINNRITYVSLNDTVATQLYGIKNYLVATLGATVVYTCDGTTGPTSSSDHTDRWASKANCTTRGALVTNPQSFVVLTWAGVQLCLAYQGASDDIYRVSFSQGSLYTPAATATNTPTATDEAIIATGATMVGLTTSNDRVYHMLGTTDRTVFRVFTYRQGALQRSWGLEQVANLSTSHTWSPAVNGWNSLGASFGVVHSVGGSAGGSTGGSESSVSRIDGTLVAMGGGGYTFNGSNASTAFAGVTPAANQGSPVSPIFLAASQPNFDGVWGQRYDLFGIYAYSLVQGDPFDDTTQNVRVVTLGGVMQPWDITKSVLMS